ncbi:helix-turn-helix domain-containing protein [Christiangramia crocea]|uniref:ATP-binding protein n=1 Tax=Christiangramia crocea TaxID=2904124 RepID=A0A9X1UV88_9FLAO|nr:ATP-binding protein [Gramella crocea]MCG9970776.1 ATP-binding protein [Gramella crocea]
MHGKNKYAGISKRAKLLLEKEEGFDVDFKRTTKISAEDLVAFANSDTGGTLLLGVDEEIQPDGSQKGKVVGCEIGDEEKLKIINKANQCFPHIKISIHQENTKYTPFYRIEIPSSKHKPHCTQAGVYKVRSDGANKPLLQGELLSIFLKQESSNFLKKYSEATLDIRKQLEKQHKTQIREMWNNTFETTTEIENVVQRIGGMVDGIQLQIEDSSFDLENFVEEIKEDTYQMKADLEITYDVKQKLQEVDKNIYSLAWKLNALLEHNNIEDPEITNARINTKNLLSFYKESITKHLGNVNGIDEKAKETIQRLYNNNDVLKETYTIEQIEEWYKNIENDEEIKN